MILIGGTELSSEELPLGEMLEYSIETNPQILEIKLKTTAKSRVCMAIYLHEDLKSSVTVPEDVEHKLTYFTSDDHLISLLDSAGQEDNKESPHEEEAAIVEPEEVSVPEFDTPQSAIHNEEDSSGLEVITSDVETSENGEVVLTEVDPEGAAGVLLTIPDVDPDVDRLRMQLELKDGLLKQKDGVIAELKHNIDQMYQYQEMQLMEMRDQYEERINKAQEAIDALKQQLKESSVPEDVRGIAKYVPYFKSYRARLEEGFSKEELESLGTLKSPLHIFAAGVGDSLHTMMGNIKNLIGQKTTAILVDFTNDYYLRVHYKFQTRESSMLLNQDEHDVASLVKDLNGVSLIPTTFFNDIAFLDFDWVKILKKLDLFADGRPLILLFNSINSFSVRYTVSKLATVGELTIFAKCNPLGLSSLTGDMAFIPANRFKIVALEYIDVVKGVLEHMAKGHKVAAFPKEVDWKKLDIPV